MKKIIFLLLFLTNSIFTAISEENDFVCAVVFQRFGESGSIDNVNYTGAINEFGLYLSGFMFSSSESKIGFHISSLISFPVGSSFVANYTNNGKTNFAIGMNGCLGPSFKLLNNNSLSMILSPVINFGLEFENGKVFNTSYIYKAFLLGGGAVLDMSLSSQKNYSFGWGTSLSVQPLYKPSLDTSDYDSDINFDNYARVLFTLYCGIHFHR